MSRENDDKTTFVYTAQLPLIPKGGKDGQTQVMRDGAPVWEDILSPLDLSLIACKNCSNISPRYTYEIEREDFSSGPSDSLVVCPRCEQRSTVFEYPIKE